MRLRLPYEALAAHNKRHPRTPLYFTAASTR
jgi:hypothetical protein